MKGPLTGQPRLALTGWEEVEVGILALVGVLLDLERVVTVLENQRPKRGPGGGWLASLLFGILCGSRDVVHEMGD